MLAAEVGEEPEKERNDDAGNEAGDDREVERSVFAAMNDVTRKSSKPKGKFAAEVEESADEDEESAEGKK